VTGIIFHEEPHAYIVDGERRISVTQVLKLAGMTNCAPVDPRVLAEKALLGTDVHKATELLDKKEPWKDKLAHVAGYVSGWKKFKREFGIKVLAREEMYFHPALNYATRIDLFADSNRGRGIFQIKATAEVGPEVAIQTAAEEHAVNWSMKLDGKLQRLSMSSPNRWAIQLFPDGTWKPHRFERPTDFKVFCSALTVAKWLLANKKARL